MLHSVDLGSLPWSVTLQVDSHHARPSHGIVCYVCSWHMSETSHRFILFITFMFWFLSEFHSQALCTHAMQIVAYFDYWSIDPSTNFEELWGEDFRDRCHFEPCAEGSLHVLFKEVPQYSQQLQRPENCNMVSRIAQEQFARIPAIDEGTFCSYSTDRQRRKS